MVDSNLGHETYTKLGKILKKEGLSILPPWIHVRTRQCKIFHEPIALPAPHVGVNLPFDKSMQLTACRILENIPPSQIPYSAVMKIKFGFDDSGSHAIYRQVYNEYTSNINMSMVCPLSISSESSDEKVWQQKSPNSALSHHPLALHMGKESAKSLQSCATCSNAQTKLKIDLLK